MVFPCFLVLAGLFGTVGADESFLYKPLEQGISGMGLFHQVVLGVSRSGLRVGHFSLGVL